MGLIAVVLGLAVMARAPEAGVGWRAAFVAIHLIGMAGVVWIVERESVSMRRLVVVAVALRVLALPMLPTLSDDGYRYLWDGLVAQEMDVSPYALRPSDPALSSLHDEPLYGAMNSPDYYSVYPPASQAVFRAAASVYPLGWTVSWWVLKTLLVLAELVGVVALACVAGPTRTALYAWSPLAVVEIAGQGHTEALVVAGLGMALWAGRAVPWASVGLTVAGLAKLYPLALLPAAWRREGSRGVLASVALAAALTVPISSPGAWAHVSESLGLFLGTLDEYAAPYLALKAALHPVLGEAAGRGASLALTAVFAVVTLVAVLIDDGTRRGLVTAIGLVVAGFTLTASTLHPWYWLPLLFLSPLLQCRWIIWIATLSTVGYLGYVVPWAGLVSLVVGWGGALVLAVVDGPGSRSLGPVHPVQQR